MQAQPAPRERPGLLVQPVRLEPTQLFRDQLVRQDLPEARARRGRRALLLPSPAQQVRPGRKVTRGRLAPLVPPLLFRAQLAQRVHRVILAPRVRRAHLQRLPVPLVRLARKGMLALLDQLAHRPLSRGPLVQLVLRAAVLHTRALWLTRPRFLHRGMRSVTLILL